MNSQHLERIYAVTYEAVLNKSGDPGAATAAAKQAVDAARAHLPTTTAPVQKAGG